MTPIVVTPPAAEPITLEEAKAHLRVVVADDDNYITGLITAARMMVEQRTQRAMMPQTIAIGLDKFCPVVQLPRAPFIYSLATPPVVIKYFDENGDLQTLAESVYHVNKYVEPAEVSLVAGQSWPSITPQPGGVTMEYQAGYADAASVPGPLKQWMLLAIGAMYDNRDQVYTGAETYPLPESFMGLLWQPYMVYT